jgi:ethanolaminephosphotransferase
VTRHIPDELGNGDWHTMILHYLGLDHIGHKAGPNRLVYTGYSDVMTQAL